MELSAEAVVREFLCRNSSRMEDLATESMDTDSQQKPKLEEIIEVYGHLKSIHEHFMKFYQTNHDAKALALKNSKKKKTTKVQKQLKKQKSQKKTQKSSVSSSARPSSKAKSPSVTSLVQQETKEELESDSLIVEIENLNKRKNRVLGNCQSSDETEKVVQSIDCSQSKSVQNGGRSSMGKTTPYSEKGKMDSKNASCDVAKKATGTKVRKKAESSSSSSRSDELSTSKTTPKAGSTLNMPKRTDDSKGSRRSSKEKTPNKSPKMKPNNKTESSSKSTESEDAPLANKTSVGSNSGSSVKPIPSLPQQKLEPDEKCKKFFLSVMKLTEDSDLKDKLKKHIQLLIDDKISPKTFCLWIHEQLKFRMGPTIISFLKQSLPSFRNSLLNGQLKGFNDFHPPPRTENMPTHSGTSSTPASLKKQSKKFDSSSSDSSDSDNGEVTNYSLPSRWKNQTSLNFKKRDSSSSSESDSDDSDDKHKTAVSANPPAKVTPTSSKRKEHGAMGELSFKKVKTSTPIQNGTTDEFVVTKKEEIVLADNEENQTEKTMAQRWFDALNKEGDFIPIDTPRREIRP